MATTISRALVAISGHGCDKTPWTAAIDYAEGEDVYIKLTSRDTGFARFLGANDTRRFMYKDELAAIRNRACFAAVRSQEPRLGGSAEVTAPTRWSETALQRKAFERLKTEAEKRDVKTVSATLPIVEWDGETYGPIDVRMLFTLHHKDAVSILATPDTLDYVRAAYLAGGSAAKTDAKASSEKCCDLPKGAYLDMSRGEHGSIVAKRSADNKTKFLVVPLIINRREGWDDAMARARACVYSFIEGEEVTPPRITRKSKRRTRRRSPTSSSGSSSSASQPGDSTAKAKLQAEAMANEDVD